MAIRDNSEIAQIEVDRILSKIYKVLPNKSKGDFIAPMHVSLCVQNLSNVIPIMSKSMNEDQFAEHLSKIIRLEFIVLLRIMDYSLSEMSKSMGENSSMDEASDIFEDELLDITRTMIKL